MQTVKITVLLLVCVALFSACGLKGPLYLPNENPVSEPAIEQEPTTEKDSKDREEDTEDNGKKNPVSI